MDRLGLSCGEANLGEWQDMLNRLENPRGMVRIALCGKYVSLHDAYKSVAESLVHAGGACSSRVSIQWVDAEDLERGDVASILDGVDGILVPGGFGNRGIEGKLMASRYARENRIPYLGICLGLQCAAIEIARNVLGLEGASSLEVDEDTPHPVISLMLDQEQVREKGGTMRLGVYPCDLREGSKAWDVYGRKPRIEERHRHRYEFNNDYRAQFEDAGIRFSGIYTEGDLVEIMEIDDHPWHVSCQFHPEFTSRPTRPNPLFQGFVRAACAHRQGQLEEPISKASNGSSKKPGRGKVSPAG